MIAAQVGQPENAAEHIRQAIRLQGNVADFHNNLGNALRARGKLEEAAACYRRALELKPNFAGAHTNLGTVLQDQGKLDEAVVCCRRAMELQPDFACARRPALCILQYCTDVTLAALAEAHAEYDRRHAAPLRPSRAHGSLPYRQQ